MRFSILFVALFLLLGVLTVMGFQCLNWEHVPNLWWKSRWSHEHTKGWHCWKGWIIIINDEYLLKLNLLLFIYLFSWHMDGIIVKRKEKKNRRDDILQPCWEWLRLLSMLYLLGLSLVRNEDSGWWWNELQGFREDIRSASLGRDQCQIWTAPSESHAGQKMNHDSHEKPEPN